MKIIVEYYYFYINIIVGRGYPGHVCFVYAKRHFSEDISLSPRKTDQARKVALCCCNFVSGVSCTRNVHISHCMKIHHRKNAVTVRRGLPELRPDVRLNPRTAARRPTLNLSVTPVRSDISPGPPK